MSQPMKRGNLGFQRTSDNLMATEKKSHSYYLGDLELSAMQLVNEGNNKLFVFLSDN